jgi:acylphosphatase
VSRREAVTFGHHVAEHQQAKRLYISGTVQGVGYRFFAQRLAGQLGISGYAKNLSDGRVEVYAVGIATQLEAFRAELRRGPRHALVVGLDELDAAIVPEWSHSFSIEDV